MQPAAILKLGLIGAGFFAVATVHLDALADDGICGGGDDGFIAGAGADGGVGQAVELLVLAVAHHQAVLVVPQHEGFRDGFHGVAQPRIGVEGGGGLLMLQGGDCREQRLCRFLVARYVTAQPHSDPTSVGMAQAEALVEFASAVAQVAIDGGAEIVVGMQ
jgi:hypothetical protein